VLRIEGLRVDYGPIKAVRGVELHVEQGEIVALLGANGAGKSSLLNAVAGLVPASAGRVELEGRELAGRPAERVVRSGIALVPEGRRVFPRLSVRDNLRLGGASQRDSARRARTRETMLELFPVLRQRLRQEAGTLSGGEQQMLAVARALMSSPRLLLLDEPSLGLAPIVVQEIFRLLENLRGTGTTILLVEQNVHLALGIADRGYLMATGQIEGEGTAHELRESGGIEQAYLGVGVRG
jgi:branched-chain amino acid transport system ATP-binding protein